MFLKVGLCGLMLQSPDFHWIRRQTLCRNHVERKFLAFTLQKYIKDYKKDRTLVLIKNEKFIVRKLFLVGYPERKGDRNNAVIWCLGFGGWATKELV